MHAANVVFIVAAGTTGKDTMCGWLCWDIERRNNNSEASTLNLFGEAYSQLITLNRFHE